MALAIFVNGIIAVVLFNIWATVWTKADPRKLQNTAEKVLEQNKFKDTYNLDRFRRNYHVVLIADSWCVHGEGAHDTHRFSFRDDAVAFARERAQSERTEAILHTTDGAVQRAWVYQGNAYPQESLQPVDKYPLEGNLGEFVV